MTTYQIRQGNAADSEGIANILLNAFDKEFAAFVRNVGRDAVLRFLADSIAPERFFLAQNDREMIAVLAISDSKGRAMKGAKHAAIRYFGPVFGRLMYYATFREFEAPLHDPPSTGYIEFVAVDKVFQRQGWASKLLQESMKLSPYTHYVLDVADTNTGAYACYARLGFVETRRESVRMAKQKGFREKIYMEYSR